MAEKPQVIVKKPDSSKDNPNNSDLVIVVKVPVVMLDFSVVEQEFSNIRDQFINQMKCVEQEMIKLQNDLKDFVHNLPQSSNTVPESPTSDAQLLNKSPLIQKDGNADILKLRFVIGNYKSDEVDVKVKGGNLLIKAVHDETENTKNIRREYYYDFKLPNCIKPDTIRSSLSKDGVLTVEAPIASQPSPIKDETIKKK